MCRNKFSAQEVLISREGCQKYYSSPPKATRAVTHEAFPELTHGRLDCTGQLLSQIIDIPIWMFSNKS